MDGSGISWTICKQSAPRSRQVSTSTPHHSIFTDRKLFLTPKQQSQSIEGYDTEHTHTFNGPFFRDYPGEPVPEK